MALKVAQTTLAGFNTWAENNRGIMIVQIHVRGDDSTVDVFYNELHNTTATGPTGSRVQQQPDNFTYSRTDING